MAFALSDVENKYYDNLEKNNQKLTKQIETQNKELEELRLNQIRLENLVIAEPSRLDKRIDDAKEIFNGKLGTANYILTALAVLITFSGIVFSVLGININRVNKAIVLKQKEYDKKLELLDNKANIIDKRLEEQKEKLPPADKDVKSYSPKDSANLEEFIRLLRREKAEKDYTAEDWFYTGLYYKKNGEYSNAISAYNEAIRLEPHRHSIWNNRGTVLFRLKKYDEAILAYDEAIKLKPDYYQALFNKGNVYAKLNKFNKAIQAYNEAIKLKPDSDKALFYKGKTYAKLSNFKKAIQAYDEAIKLKPDYYQAWHNKGNAQYKSNQHADAIKSYDEAIRINPDSYSAWYNKGIALQDIHNYDNAIASYNEAIRIKPDHFNAHHNKARCLKQLGNLTEALESINESLKYMPYDSVNNSKIQNTHDEILNAIAERNKANASGDNKSE